MAESVESCGVGESVDSLAVGSRSEFVATGWSVGSRLWVGSSGLEGGVVGRPIGRVNIMKLPPVV